MNSTKTISDLQAFCKRQAKLSTLDYDAEGLRSDRNRIRQAKRAAEKSAGMYWAAFPEKPLECGEYFGGRLIVKKNSIEYIPGQYAPTEIYWALEDYFKKVRGLK